jgi:hypothetical protein
MPYLNSKIQAKREMLMNVDKVEQLPSPRVVRPHTPIHLLPPTLFDIAKVLHHRLYNKFTSSFLKTVVVEFRLFTWLAIQRMLLYLIISITS